MAKTGFLAELVHGVKTAGQGLSEAVDAIQLKTVTCVGQTVNQASEW